MLIVFLIGYRVAAWPGALAAGLGMFVPTSVLLAGVAWLTQRPRSLIWVKRFHAAIEPISIGLIASATWILGQDLVGHPFLMGGCGCAAIGTIRNWLSPIWLIGFAILIGLIRATVLES
jgi:chromate transporter